MVFTCLHVSTYSSIYTHTHAESTAISLHTRYIALTLPRVTVDAVASKLPGVPVLGVPVGGYIFPHPNYDGPDAQHEVPESWVATCGA